MLKYTTDIKRRYINTPVGMKMEGNQIISTNVEKRYINTLEIFMQENLKDRNDLLELMESVYPQIKELLVEDTKMGLRITNNQKIIKTIVTANDNSYTVYRKILPSYVVNIEQKTDINKPSKDDGNCM